MANRSRAAGGLAPRPIRRPADQVRLTILQAILSGQVRPGDRLPSEDEQAHGFQVSRAVVREALQPLARQGLLRVVPGRGGGAFVNQLDSAPAEQELREAMELLLHLELVDLHELLEAREALDSLCASLGATRATEQDLNEIRGILERARDSRLSDHDWLQDDIRFHRAVANSGHNRALVVPLAALHALVQPTLNLAILPVLSRPKVNSQHWSIYEAIASRSPRQAEDAVRTHLAYLKKLYRLSGVLQPASSQKTAGTV